MDGDREVDVRQVPPRERHRVIFETFAELQPGQTLLLTADHEPRPLHNQFQSLHAGRFSWEYLEQGPAVWRVRIGRNG